MKPYKFSNYICFIFSHSNEILVFGINNNNLNVNFRHIGFTVGYIRITSLFVVKSNQQTFNEIVKDKRYSVIITCCSADRRSLIPLTYLVLSVPGQLLGSFTTFITDIIMILSLLRTLLFSSFGC